MRYLLPVLAIGLTSCVTVKDVRSKGVFYQSVSHKSVDALAECVTDALRIGAGVNVSSTPMKDGVSLVQSISGQFGYTVFMTADIERTETGSHLTVYSVNGPSKKESGVKLFADCVA